MTYFADKVIKFNRELDFSEILPKGIRVKNPFKENKEIGSIVIIMIMKNCILQCKGSLYLV
jgi:hypothetical protein